MKNCRICGALIDGAAEVCSGCAGGRPEGDKTVHAGLPGVAGQRTAPEKRSAGPDRLTVCKAAGIALGAMGAVLFLAGIPSIVADSKSPVKAAGALALTALMAGMMAFLGRHAYRLSGTLDDSPVAATLTIPGLWVSLCLILIACTGEFPVLQAAGISIATLAVAHLLWLYAGRYSPGYRGTSFLFKASFTVAFLPAALFVLTTAAGRFFGAHYYGMGMLAYLIWPCIAGFLLFIAAAIAAARSPGYFSTFTLRSAGSGAPSFTVPTGELLGALLLAAAANFIFFAAARLPLKRLSGAFGLLFGSYSVILPALLAALPLYFLLRVLRDIFRVRSRLAAAAAALCCCYAVNALYLRVPLANAGFYGAYYTEPELAASMESARTLLQARTGLRASSGLRLHATLRERLKPEELAGLGEKALPYALYLLGEKERRLFSGSRGDIFLWDHPYSGYASEAIRAINDRRALPELRRLFFLSHKDSGRHSPLFLAPLRAMGRPFSNAELAELLRDDGSNDWRGILGLIAALPREEKEELLLAYIAERIPPPDYSWRTLDNLKQAVLGLDGAGPARAHEALRRLHAAVKEDADKKTAAGERFESYQCKELLRACEERLGQAGPN